VENKGKATTTFLAVPLADEEWRAVELAAKVAGVEPSQWARSRLVAAADRPTPYAQMREAHRLSGSGFKGRQIPERLGVQPSYVSKLLRVASLQPRILNAWEKSYAERAPVALLDMYRIACEPASLQDDEFKRALGDAAIRKRKHGEQLALPRTRRRSGNARTQ
jgi:hypothetical protein